MKRKTQLLAAMAVIGLASGIGAVNASASTDTKTNPMSSIVSAIAKKFNLKESDVQQVFIDQHTQIQTQQQQVYKDRIAKAVTNGKLTQAQADKILAKMAELTTFKASLLGKTPTEIKTAMKAQMDSLKQWAKDNNIPKNYLLFGFGEGKERGHGFGMMNHMRFDFEKGDK